MYRDISADQYREKLGFPIDYKVDAMLCYGTLYEQRVLSQLEGAIEELGIKAEINEMPHEFLRFARQIRIGDKDIWFAICYGGAWLSEYLHWACLFGSKKNILLGSCGGLKHGIKQGDFIVPESSFGEESSAKMYGRESNLHYSDKKLSKIISKELETDGAKVWYGPTVTCQAMVGETLNDVRQWSADGYFGVEMEASTVFAVSNHFNVPSAASLYVGDNLIEGHSHMSEEYATEERIRQRNRHLQLKIAVSTVIS